MKLEAYFEEDPRLTTERILDRMTDPEQIAKRERAKKESKRLAGIRSRVGL